MTPTELAADLVVIGLPLRTSPERAVTEIGPHWQRFMREGIASTIAAKAGDAHLYAVYCDYESDHRGPYTMVLGVAVEPDTVVPPGLRRVRVPVGRYASFAAKGDPAQVIWQTWTYVSSEWKERERRRFIADFERYAPGAMSASSVDADVMVGLS